MSDQAKNAGHHAITREAVRQFFQSGRAVDGKIDGMTEIDYFHALDAAQYDRDVSVHAGPAEIPSYGTGVPSAWDGDAQREHGMADPAHGGQYNLDADRSFVEGQLADAHTSANRGTLSSIVHEGWDSSDTEMAHLGAASHALEDSYSEAHAFRGDAVNSGDPNAPIDSFNVWRPLPHDDDEGNFHWGKAHGDQQGTHDERFDAVPVDGAANLDQDFGASPVPLVHGSDRAAAEATARMLGTYEDNRTRSADAAEGAVHNTIDPFYQAPAGATTGVNRDEGDPAWIAERDRRLAEHEAEDHAGDGGMSVQPPPDDPNAPNQSFQPDEPIQSIQPDEPNQSVDPNAPNQSVQSDEPNQSVDPNAPNQSVQPDEPNQSVDPNAPNQSVQPDAPNQSVQPDAPNQSVDPNAPNQSVQPDEPNQSVDPNAPNQSVQPDEPNQSTQPNAPNQSTQP